MMFRSVAVALLLSSTVNAFAPAVQQRTVTQRWSTPTAEQSAKAMTDYMTKAHEEKLKAVKAAEQQKQGEIEALKEQVNQLKASAGTGGALVTVEAPAGSIEDLQQKLVSYQTFMARYIVEAQEAKYLAVADAKASVEQKYQTLLLAAPAAPAAAAAPQGEVGVYQGRSMHISKAAAAGKSRWGDSEVQRIDTGATPPPPKSQAVPAATAAAPIQTLSTVPPEVEVANHGLRADGGVGGLSLADRVVGGAGSAVAGVANAAASEEKIIYYQRNARIAVEGANSRWGPMEVSKALTSAALPVPSAVAVVPREVKEADHGLRNDGGVGGPSLADRVNLGAQLLGAK